MSTLEIICPGCSKSIQAPREAIGRKATCNACKTKFVIEDTNQHDWLSEVLESGQQTQQPELASPPPVTTPEVEFAQTKYVVIRPPAASTNMGFFDLNFQVYYSIGVIRFLWCASIILAGGAVLFALARIPFSLSNLSGSFLFLIFTVVGAALALVVLRLCFEGMIAAFDMADNLKAIRRHHDHRSDRS